MQTANNHIAEKALIFSGRLDAVPCNSVTSRRCSGEILDDLLVQLSAFSEQDCDSVDRAVHLHPVGSITVCATGVELCSTAQKANNHIAEKARWNTFV